MKQVIELSEDEVAALVIAEAERRWQLKLKATKFVWYYWDGRLTRVHVELESPEEPQQ